MLMVVDRIRSWSAPHSLAGFQGVTLGIHPETPPQAWIATEALTMASIVVGPAKHGHPGFQVAPQCVGDELKTQTVKVYVKEEEDQDTQQRTFHMCLGIR